MNERQFQMTGMVWEALAQEEPTERNGTRRDANTVCNTFARSSLPQANLQLNTLAAARNSENWSYNLTLAAGC